LGSGGGGGGDASGSGGGSGTGDQGGALAHSSRRSYSRAKTSNQAITNPITPTPATNNNNNELQFKLILLGDYGVGKTTLLKRFCGENLVDNSTPSRIEVKTALVPLEQETIQFQIWDTGGQERFRSLTTSYYRNAMGLMLVFDVTDRKSFEDIRHWFNEARLFAPTLITRGNVVLIGNKIDLLTQRCITNSEAEDLASELNVKFIELSGQEGTNVASCLKWLAEKCRKSVQA
jgi:small GTP-binding protein